MVEYSNRKCQAGLIEQFFGVLLLISALRRFKIVALYREINQLLAMDLHLIQRGEPGGIQLMAERNLAGRSGCCGRQNKQGAARSGSIDGTSLDEDGSESAGSRSPADGRRY